MKTDIESVKTLHKYISDSIQKGEYILSQWDTINEISIDLSTFYLKQQYNQQPELWQKKGINIDCGLCYNMQLDKTFRTMTSSDIPKKKFKKIFGMEKLTGIGTLDAYMGHIWQSCLGKHYSGKSRYPLAEFEAIS